MVMFAADLFFLLSDQSTQGLKLRDPFLLLGNHIRSPLLSQIRCFLDHLHRPFQSFRNIAACLYFLDKMVVLLSENITSPGVCQYLGANEREDDTYK